MQNSLLSHFDHYASKHPHKPVFISIDNQNLRGKPLTYLALQQSAHRVAAHLQKRNHTRKNILLCYSGGVEFMIAFLGCLYAGSTAVLFPYLEEEDHQIFNQKIQRVMDKIDISFVLATRETLQQLTFPDKLSVESMDHELTYIPEEIHLHQTTHMLFTSGSTGDPKLVVFDHQCLLENLAYTSTTWNVTSDSIHLHWGFAFHSAGLMVGYLLPLFNGTTGILLKADLFHKMPFIFPTIVSEYRITHSACPNYAFDYLLGKNSDLVKNTSKALDLKSWKVAIIGGDPLQASTIVSFQKCFSEMGFHVRLFQAAYGMTEATGLITTGDTSEEPTVMSFPLKASKYHRTGTLIPQSFKQLSKQNISQLDFVNGEKILLGCGKATHGTEIIITDLVDQQPIHQEESIGEIWFHSPSLAKGYITDTQPDPHFDHYQKSFNDKMYFPTGDLGFLYQSELFVLGRKSEILQIGENVYYPLFVELIVTQFVDEVNPRSGAAFMIIEQGRPIAVLVQEIASKHYTHLAIIEDKIRQRVQSYYELILDQILFIEENSLPKIAGSGKIQRKLCKEKFLSNQLKVIERQYA